MKSNFDLKTLMSSLFISIVLLVACSDSTTQKKESSGLKPFKVVLEKTENGIKINCEKGCAWNELTFNKNDYQPQAIDEYGMTELNKNSSTKKDVNLSDFLFTITKINDGIELKGIEGTAWTELSFSLLNNQKQMIDQNGMTGKN